MLHNNTQKVIRLSILLILLAGITILGKLHSIIKIYPAIDAFCPFGGLESLFTFIRYNAFLKRIALSSMILFGAVLLITIIFRRSFCGNICPLGFLQEISARIGRKLLRKRFYLPARADKLMRFIKYIILVIVIGGTWLTTDLIFRPMDPWAAFHHIGSDELFSGYLIGAVILTVSLAASFFLDRFFCKYLCPMGAFLAPISKIGAFRIRNNKKICTSCGKCDSTCPMNIEVSTTENINFAECINCMECTANCPVNALTVSGWRAGKRTIKPTLLIVITLLIFILIVGTTTITKQFAWKAPTGLPHKTERLLWGPQRLKNNNSFEDVVTIFRINPEYIQQIFEINGDDFSKSFSEIGINPDDIESFITEIYTEAGLNPKRLYAGGSCGSH